LKGGNYVDGEGDKRIADKKKRGQTLLNNWDSLKSSTLSVTKGCSKPTQGGAEHLRKGPSGKGFITGR